MINAFVMMVMINAPTSVPTMEPLPPNKLVPPRMTAVIASRFRSTPTSGRPYGNKLQERVGAHLRVICSNYLCA